MLRGNRVELKLQMLGCVGSGLQIRHRADSGVATRLGALGPTGYCLFIFKSGFAEVHMQVCQSGHHRQSGGLDYLHVGLSRNMLGQTRHTPVGHEQIESAQTIRRVYLATLYEFSFHVKLFLVGRENEKMRPFPHRGNASSVIL